MSMLGIISFSLAILFVVMLMRSWDLVKKRRWIRAGFWAVPTTFTLLGLFFLLLIISNLSTYQRLTNEREIVLVSIAGISNQNFKVSLDYLDSELDRNPDTFYLKGDEWRLEARVLKWLGWVNLVGLDSYYQLDRLSGRYRNIEQANTQLPGVHALSGELRGIDLWRLKRLMNSYLPFLDAYYGQAIFLPMQDGAIFKVFINQTGLVARPENELAQQALDGW